jgi:hypothetical protein
MGHMAGAAPPLAARTRADTSLRTAYRPRGVLVSKGEQLLGGQSVQARFFAVEIGPYVTDESKLSTAQD